MDCIQIWRDGSPDISYFQEEMKNPFLKMADGSHLE